MDPSKHAKIKELFLRACKLEPAERASFLDSACEGDAELRREVDSLLVHDSEADIVTPTSRERGRNSAGSPRADAALLVPSEGHTRTRQLFSGVLSRHVWITLAGSLGILVLGLWVHNHLKKSLLRASGREIQTVLEATSLSFEAWVNENLTSLEVWANDPRLKALVDELLEVDPRQPDAPKKWRESSAQADLKILLRPLIGNGRNGYDVFTEEGRVFASSSDGVIGAQMLPHIAEERQLIFQGSNLFYPPFRGNENLNLPTSPNATLWVGWVAPIRIENDGVVAALAKTRQVDSFNRILAAGTPGKTGETYAFRADGTMMSESRFTEACERAGLIPGNARGRSGLTVQVRDPGTRLNSSSLAAPDLHALPLTRLAREAIAARAQPDPAKRQGLILDPYRNYLGREVIGAWRWFPDYQLGICTEIEVEEVLQPLFAVDVSIALVFGIFLVVTGVGAATSMALKRHYPGGSTVTGQYQLVRRIGEGGLGIVYLAQHSMLKRPTAVKILKPDQSTSESVRRFEKEVQMASQLTHPNTIEIYDYGRTREGLFYYVMEYLDGLNLNEAVTANEGPFNVARTIHVLRQICESLEEAHQLRFIHRDIKPMNIMLCQRGARYDVVKVLDFGLVKKLEGDQTTDVTAPHLVSGTLMYMAPERIRNPREVDPRTDVYSVGAVGYYLLTGRSPFEQSTDLDMLYQVVNVDPGRPAAHTPSPIPVEMDDLIVACLAKKPGNRPADATELIRRLDTIPLDVCWSQESARAWWERIQSTR